MNAEYVGALTSEDPDQIEYIGVRLAVQTLIRYYNYWLVFYKLMNECLIFPDYVYIGALTKPRSRADMVNIGRIHNIENAYVRGSA